MNKEEWNNLIKFVVGQTVNELSDYQEVYDLFQKMPIDWSDSTEIWDEFLRKVEKRVVARLKKARENI